MNIDLGDVKRIVAVRTGTLFSSGKTKVTEVGIFVDFEKVGGLCISIDRKAAVRLQKDIQRILDYELKR